MEIESAQNPTFKRLLSLTSAKGLKQEGLFLLSGEKLVREFLAKPNLEIEYELVPPGKKPLTKFNVLKPSLALFKEIDVLGTHANILVLQQPKIETLADMEDYKPQGIEAVLPIGDPGNLGALIRSCEAFKVPRAILTKEAAHPFLPKSVKASAGSVLRLPLLRGPALAEFPPSAMALDMQGTPLANFKWPKDGLLVMGEEGGFAAMPFKQRICIPTEGVESLNVVVATSIALAHKSGVFGK